MLKNLLTLPWILVYVSKWCWFNWLYWGNKLLKLSCLFINCLCYCYCLEKALFVLHGWRNSWGIWLWSCSQACLATEDFSTCALQQLFMCSLILVFRLRFVSPIYTRPHSHGILKTLGFNVERVLSLRVASCWHSLRSVLRTKAQQLSKDINTWK